MREEDQMTEMFMDNSGDGIVDAVTFDAIGDGVHDTFALDVDQNGRFEVMVSDTDGNGAPDVWMWDDNQNGTFERMAVDTTGEGQMDHFIHDTNGDEIGDTVVLDANLNGLDDRSEGPGSMTIGPATNRDPLSQLVLDLVEETGEPVFGPPDSDGDGWSDHEDARPHDPFRR